MKLLHFEPHSPFAPAFAYELEVGDAGRRLEVCRWDDRLVAYEKESELWWCTLDACNQRDTSRFWDECVTKGRVGRFFSVRRGFQRSRTPGATLQLGAHSFYVVIGNDNNGIACAHDETTWQSFPTPELRGIHKPLAHRPTIWSPHFQPRYGLRGLDTLGESYEVAAMMEAPKNIRLLWSEGANALPLRLITAALAIGWVDPPRYQLKLTPAEFWQTVLERRAGLQGKSRFSLPKRLLQSSEFALPGHIALQFSYYPEANTRATFVWHGSEVVLSIGCGRTGTLSMHEQLERRLELRDWLLQFFDFGKIKPWLDS